jgi:flavin-binding protein dodecin
MQDHVYKLIEIVGTSPNSIEDAIQNAVARAAKTVHNMRWLEVLQTRAAIENGKVVQYQVIVKLGFTLD